MPLRRRLALLLLALTAASCSLTVGPAITPRTCPDGLPPKPLLHQSCAHGVCGYTCEPGRWPPLVDDAR